MFQKLVETINWDSVNEEVRCHFNEFGIFLQIHEFEEHLSWPSIHKLCSELQGHGFRRVRECLEDLGSLLFDSEDKQSEECNINPLLPVAWFPSALRATMEQYEGWLCDERKNTPLSRQDHFVTLSHFWKYCTNRGLKSLAVVEGAHVEEFLYILSVKWRCRQCSFTKNIAVRVEVPPAVCENSACRAVGSFEKVVRCKERTVFGHRGALRIFFGWLKDVEQGIEINPAPAAQRRNKKKRGSRRTRKYPATIQYYEWEVVLALLNAIEDPNTPAEEALVLYLILHHGFFIRELLTVRIPERCRPIALGIASPEGLEDLRRLEWLPRDLSRNKQFLGRSGEIFQMEPADEPWMRELVARFMRERSQKLRDFSNPYLLIATNMSRPRGPVTYGYLRQVVQRATARVTGRVCTIGILSKSSRLLYSEFGGYEGVRHLREMGLCPAQALNYAWAQRIRVIPSQAIRTAPFARHRKSNLTIPPIDVFGLPTAFSQV